MRIGDRTNIRQTRNIKHIRLDISQDIRREGGQRSHLLHIGCIFHRENISVGQCRFCILSEQIVDHIISNLVHINRSHRSALQHKDGLTG